jgi:hypothetical protein
MSHTKYVKYIQISHHIPSIQKKKPGSSVAPHDEAHPPSRGYRQGPVATFPQVHHTTALLVLVGVEVLASEVGQLSQLSPS